MSVTFNFNDPYELRCAKAIYITTVFIIYGTLYLNLIILKESVSLEIKFDFYRICHQLQSEFIVPRRARLRPISLTFHYSANRTFVKFPLVRTRYNLCLRSLGS